MRLWFDAFTIVDISTDPYDSIGHRVAESAITFDEQMASIAITQLDREPCLDLVGELHKTCRRAPLKDSGPANYSVTGVSRKNTSYGLLRFIADPINRTCRIV
jgi:hypothetical protein